MENIYHGLWMPKNSLNKINACLETGVWTRENCKKNRHIEAKKISAIKEGEEVFLYRLIEDVKLTKSEFYKYLDDEIEYGESSVAQAECYSIGKVISTDPDNLKVTVDWDSNYKKRNWFIYVRQDGVWNHSTDITPSLDLEKSSRLYNIIFKQEEMDYQWWAKYSCKNNKLKGNNKSSRRKEDIEHSLNTILFGPPGTGKTYQVIHKALDIIEGNDYSLPGEREEAVKKFNEYVEKKQIVFTTFHQSFSYEDFVEGIKPILEESDEEGKLAYTIEKGVFRALCEYQFSNGNLEEMIEELKKELSKKSKPLTGVGDTKKFNVSYRGGKTFIFDPVDSEGTKNYYASIENIKKVYYKEVKKYDVYNAAYVNAILKYFFEVKELKEYDSNLDDNKKKVIIIDEINRGNIASIFGELITLIEDDKRIGSENTLKVTLPYSKKEFGVPKNLYIIGTMNTADRSVEALDSALRRRFVFVEVGPDSSLLKDITVENINMQKLLDKINKRIEVLLDRDHLIGHSYFINVKTIKDLMLAFGNKVLPLLQEYFYGDYGKIALVVGEGFCRVEKSFNSSVFAKVNYYNSDHYSDKLIYTLENVSDMADEAFIKAIYKLIDEE